VDIVLLKSFPLDLRLEVPLNSVPIVVRDRVLYTELIKEGIVELEYVEIAIRTATERKTLDSTSRLE